MDCLKSAKPNEKIEFENLGFFYFTICNELYKYKIPAYKGNSIF